MDEILDGVRRFRAEVYPEKRGLFRSLADGQAPRALFITCSDSRVVPELITQSQPGDLFISRNAGNIVPPYGPTPCAVSAAIEYAVLVLGVPDIVVCGHSDCGAMKAVLHPEGLDDLPSVAGWLRHADAARRVVAETGCGHGHGSGEAGHLAALTGANVAAQIANLRTHPAVAARGASDRLRLHGWVYDIAAGEVRALDHATGGFAPLGRRALGDGAEADGGREPARAAL